MASLQDTYQLKEDKVQDVYKFAFLSRGAREVMKVIEYTYIQQFEDRRLYNLGFGDHDVDDNRLTDLANTNNGDAYKVLRTVLSTVPLFFKHFPEAILLVQGSDGRSDFSSECRKSCTKKCTSICRKFNQRIALYRNYIEKHYAELSLTYWFLGGFADAQSNMSIELYLSGRQYDSIFLFKK